MTLRLIPRASSGFQLVTEDGTVWATGYPYVNGAGKTRWTATLTKASPAGFKRGPQVDTEDEAQAWVLGVLGVES